MIRSMRLMSMLELCRHQKKENANMIKDTKWNSNDIKVSQKKYHVPLI